jgi:hypothetical protein
MQTAVGLYYIGVATGGNRLFFATPTDGQQMVYALSDGESVTNGQNLAASAMLSPGATRRVPSTLRARPWGTIAH